LNAGVVAQEKEVELSAVLRSRPAKAGVVCSKSAARRWRKQEVGWASQTARERRGSVADGVHGAARSVFASAVAKGSASVGEQARRSRVTQGTARHGASRTEIAKGETTERCAEGVAI